MTPGPPPTDQSRVDLLYHFCRLQLPGVSLSQAQCVNHLNRTFELFRAKANGNGVEWTDYLDQLYPLDWFLASACLDGVPNAWDHLFASRAGRTDCLLMDALRARSARLYPRDEERQESAVTEFWSNLFAPENLGSLPILARYDGQRPLVPWLIRVFQNWHISQLRKNNNVQALPEDDLALPLPENGDARWREAFAVAAQEWLTELGDQEILLLGLRLRYRLSQREVANLLKVHEGTISRRTDSLRDQCLEYLSKRLIDQGWTGDNLFDMIRTEMHSILLDDSRLSADHLGKLPAQKGRDLPHSA